jgi:predicted dehydrogenase
MSSASVTEPRPTVGIVGLGYGRAHIPGFQANGCNVVAVCQRDEATARKIAGTYGVPQVFTRWQDLIARAKPDVVVIATPPHLHRTIALAAFEAGAHVLCEKPVAMNVGEARDMIAAAARAGRIAMTDFNWRFTSGMQELRSLVHGGAIGRPLHLAGRWLGARWADESAAATWRMDRAQAGSGAMGDMGVHLVDMIRWSFGEFARVTAHSGVAYPSRSAPGVSRPADAEDYCTVVGQLTSGAEVTFTVSRVAHGANEHTLEAYGTSGAVSYRLAREGPSWHAGDLKLAKGGSGFQRVETRPVPPTVEGDPMDQIGRATIAPLVARLLEGIKTGQTPSPSLEDGMRAQAVLDAIAEASARGRWVDVR